MELKSADERPQRRRGSRLEADILAAAWAQLSAVGYPNFTFEGVAQAAGTSRSVIYRRWPDRDALVTAAIEHGLEQTRPALPDTGTLRSDVLTLLRGFNAARAPFIGLLSALMGTYFSTDGLTFAELRGRLLGARAGSAMDDILQRAVERGELSRLPSSVRVRNLAADLLRHDLLMTLEPMPDDTIVAIVDEVYLPLLRAVS